MLGEALAQVTPLHVVEAPRITAVVPGEQPALRVELHPKRVAAALGEDLVAARPGMVTPNVLPHRWNLFFIETGPTHFRGNRAALRGVEPAVRPPAQAVHH